MTETELAGAIRDTFLSSSETDQDGEAATVDAIYSSGRAIARALQLLGNADAATPMGAIEAHGAVIKETGARIAEGLESIAAALDNLADAITRAGREGGA